MGEIGKRTTRRTRGRPSKDERDQIITEAAQALRVLYGLGRQTARDLGVHFVTRSPDVESGKLTFTEDEVRGIGEAVLRKHLRPRTTMLAALVLMSMDQAAMIRCVHTLLTLDAMNAREHVRRLIESVAHR